MRLRLQLERSSSIIPYDHIPVLAGVLHKWLGPNTEHGGLSLYSFSWLEGGKAGPKGLQFHQGATWTISALDDEFLRKSIDGIFQDPEVRWGLEVKEVVIQMPPKFEHEKVVFPVSSPVLVKSPRPDGSLAHLLYNDPASDEVMTQTMRHKMDVANMDWSGMALQFDRSYPGAKTQKVNYKGIENRCSYCPVIATGSPEQLAFIWTVGIGHSTGVGFGGVK